MIIRFGLAIRLVAVISTLLLTYSLAEQLKFNSLICAALVICVALTAYALSYKVTMSEAGIEIRYYPFARNRIPWSDVLHVVEDRVPLCITKSSSFRVWGVTAAARSNFLRLVPERLIASDRRMLRYGEILDAARKYMSRSKTIGLLLALCVGLLVPFLDNNSLNRYWYPFGAGLLLVVLCLFLGELFVSGMALIHWLEYRDLTRNQAHPKGK